MIQQPSETAYTPTFFARQPIFTRSSEVWGYEFFYRDRRDAETANISDSHLATLEVAASAFIHPDTGRQQTKFGLITFDERSILEDLPLALPSGMAVIKFAEPDSLSRQLLGALRRLKEEGYRLAVDNFTAEQQYGDLYKLADVLVVDALENDDFDLKRLLAGARRYDADVLAKRVEDRQRYHAVSSMGFDLFGGFFFQKPEIVPGRKLSSNEASRLSLFRILERSEPDFDELARMVETDVSISYRLLSYLNSAAFSFTRKISSIKQAVVILGWNKVRNWLRLIILTDLVPEGKTHEIPYLSAIRGKFLERVALGQGMPEATANEIFLLGLFSLLEPMLDAPMDRILKNVPLDDSIKAALCGDENEHALWLELAACFEKGDWDRLDTLMRELRLEPLEVARDYYESLVWANSFFGFKRRDEAGAAEEKAEE
ncbi:EAL and HDOD domain-containing protein [Desulfohalovibrio reitneri]|uniref:EAL and HDOD domain-containing protein n=1 Tax=Desulfohalovibrio reitneri TaxID=1307759 RepID=UPI000689F21F|nr:HDOD domain-containing protein [Desulfohalovibrio reitneri]